MEFDFGLRAVPGANEAAGKVCLYRGPLLLAWDQAHTSYDEAKIPAVDLGRLADARVMADQAPRQRIVGTSLPRSECSQSRIDFEPAYCLYSGQQRP